MKQNTQRSTATTTIAALLLGALSAFNAQAQEPAKMDHAGHDMSHASEPAAAPSADSTQVMTDGEVLRVNLAAGKVSIRHAAIANLNMPAMSMVFALKNPAELTKLKEGDKVRFHVERETGALLITQIEVVAQ
ncbi:copper-binding protein [Diaphorobacter sp. HDW4A]|uniref:copper-binding protein n=1 Tax=Diaphorobacter sp. HDW4A TaxID=2714924 RepID=UPI00140CF858|nr:copper-binding protein [Diaphorobacter sp. HDW4A]QIL79612.1 copper-binding protein [Diaphorobacter sp. HDW4A]